jgi:hypothetical protein
MSTPTYTLINQITLVASSTNVVLSSIPQFYRDLIVVLDIPALDGSMEFRLNQDASNHSSVFLYGFPASSASTYTDTKLGEPSSGSQKRLFTYHVMDYSSVDKHKTILSRLNNDVVTVAAGATRWASLSPVTSIGMVRSPGFPVNTIFSLYGIVG